MQRFYARTLVGSLVLLLGAAVARADDRKFTYSYEAKTLPKGTWEFEQHATVQSGREDGRWNTLLLREEIEYGVTDRLNGSIYLNLEWQNNNGMANEDDAHEFGFQSMSTEWKYKLTDPSADLVGVLLYGEIAFSNDEYEFETKLVLSKEMGEFTFAFNFIYEAELAAGDPGDSPLWVWEHIVSTTIGASYSILPTLSVGVEGVYIFRRVPSEGEHTDAMYVGPNIHLSSGSWWATLTVLKQVGSLELTDEDNTKYAVRLIVGVNF